MARYLGARSRPTRMTGIDLGHFTKPASAKCKSQNRPGHSDKRRVRSSDYGVQLEMKHAIKHFYGLLEKQFKNYFHEADRMKGSTADNLIKLLESRLDNTVFRMGFAVTRREARQIVSHGHILVNGKRCNIPARLLKSGDKIEIVEKVRSQLRIQTACELSKDQSTVEWINVDRDTFSGEVVNDVDPSIVADMFKANLVVELYSK